MRPPRLLPLLVSAALSLGCQRGCPREAGPLAPAEALVEAGEPAAMAFGAQPAGRPAQALPSGLAAAKEEFVEVRAEPPAAAEPGQKASVRVSFHPKPHVKVPIYPPAYAESFEVYGGLGAPAARVLARVLTPEEEDKGRLAYYESEPPVLTFEIGVPAGTQPGSYPFAARVHYFYCHDTGGICAKRDVRVEGVLDVKAEEKGRNKP